MEKDKIELIRRTVAKGATDAEIELLLEYAERTGLDPIARQIYLSERQVKRGEDWVTIRTPETTIDGFRVIAENSGRYAGQLGPYWCGDDGSWRDVWLENKPPVAAKVGVLRHDFKEPLFAVALYREYVQTKRDGTPNSMWVKMGAAQLAKCAEALALRKAIPLRASGLYTREEMEQAGNSVPLRESDNPETGGMQTLVSTARGETIDERAARLAREKAAQPKAERTDELEENVVAGTSLLPEPVRIPSHAKNGDTPNVDAMEIVGTYAPLFPNLTGNISKPRATLGTAGAVESYKALRAFAASNSFATDKNGAVNDYQLAAAMWKAGFPFEAINAQNLELARAALVKHYLLDKQLETEETAAV